MPIGHYNEGMSQSPLPRQLFENVGIGVDVADIGRFTKLNRRTDRHFLNRLFTRQELRYCFSRATAAPHLAARFAAKEAAIKALAMLNVRVSDWRELEVKRQKSGAPQLILPKQLGVGARISISHDQNIAIAVVIIFRHAV